MTTELDAVRADLRERIPRLLAEHSIPGLAIGVLHGPDTWLAGFGGTRRAGGTPVGELTTFSLQSISKTFAALTVLSAVRDGLLGLDDPVSRRLPEFTVRSRFEDRPQDRMTIRHLLSHTAGFTHEAPVGSNFDVGDESFDCHVRSISDTWLRYPVGARYEYSNLGIDLAAQIAAGLRGQDFAACASEVVFGPLGLARSSFDPAEIEATADRAIGHGSDGRQCPVKVPMVAAGGMYSCASDLVRFLRAEIAGPVLPAQLATEMRTVPFPVPGQVGGYGLGLAVIAGPDWTVYGHSGGGFGFLTDLYWEPAAGSGVVILTNSTEHPLQVMLALEILARLAGRDPEQPYGPLPRPDRPAAHEYGPLCGEYAGRGCFVRLVPRAGGIGIQAEDGQVTLVGAADSGELVVSLAPSGRSPRPPVRLRLMPGADGRPDYAVVLDDGSTLSYNSATEPPPTWAAARATADAAAYAGEYDLGDGKLADVSARIELDRERLWLAIPDLAGLPRLRLDPHPDIERLYFTATGEALDLRSDPPRYASIRLSRRG
jgi:CubicO group peptidase (beta-lactamase class C family)